MYQPGLKDPFKHLCTHPGGGAITQLTSFLCLLCPKLPATVAICIPFRPKLAAATLAVSKPPLVARRVPASMAEDTSATALACATVFHVHVALARAWFCICSQLGAQGDISCHCARTTRGGWPSLLGSATATAGLTRSDPCRASACPGGQKPGAHLLTRVNQKCTQQAKHARTKD